MFFLLGLIDQRWNNNSKFCSEQMFEICLLNLASWCQRWRFNLVTCLLHKKKFRFSFWPPAVMQKLDFSQIYLQTLSCVFYMFQQQVTMFNHSVQVQQNKPSVKDLFAIHSREMIMIQNKSAYIRTNRYLFIMNQKINHLV